MGKSLSGDGLIEYKSLSNLALDFIRSRIIEGDWPQGSRLKEEDLARSLGVSRACIREAFVSLEAEGLVRKVPNKYTEVIRFEEEDVEDIVMLRCAIEVLSAETCIRKGTVPLKELKRQVQKIESITSETTQNIRGYVEADLDLHEIIVYGSRNRRAAGIWNGIKSQMKTLLFSVIRSNCVRFRLASVEDHNVIVRALASSDVEGVRSVLRKHIEGTLYILNAAADPRGVFL